MLLHDHGTMRTCAQQNCWGGLLCAIIFMISEVRSASCHRENPCLSSHNIGLLSVNFYRVFTIGAVAVDVVLSGSGCPATAILARNRFCQRVQSMTLCLQISVVDITRSRARTHSESLGPRAPSLSPPPPPLPLYQRESQSCRWQVSAPEVAHFRWDRGGPGLVPSGCL